MKGLVIILFITLFCSSIHAQNHFTFERKQITPGTKEHFMVPIDDGMTKTSIPITIFHGSKPGPVLGITCGIHGFEYPPIVAGQLLINDIDPRKLSGTIILVQVANLASFLARSPFNNPIDKQNLNRSFPGNKNGSISQQIAHFISKKVIKRSNYFLDIHGGDAPEDLMPYIAYYHHDDFKERSSKGRKMCLSMGFDHVVVFNTTEKDYMKAEHPSTYCSAEAFKIGIPSIDIECGRMGQAEALFTNKIVNGVKALLGHLEMTMESTNEAVSPIIIWERSYLESEHQGIFYPSKKSGDFVSKGMKLGHITDFFGKTIQELVAKEEGIILLILGTPPVNRGETIAVIGSISE